MPPNRAEQIKRIRRAPAGRSAPRHQHRVATHGDGDRAPSSSRRHRPHLAAVAGERVAELHPSGQVPDMQRRASSRADCVRRGWPSVPAKGLGLVSRRGAECHTVRTSTRGPSSPSSRPRSRVDIGVATTAAARRARGPAGRRTPTTSACLHHRGRGRRNVARQSPSSRVDPLLCSRRCRSSCPPGGRRYRGYIRRLSRSWTTAPRAADLQAAGGRRGGDQVQQRRARSPPHARPPRPPPGPCDSASAAAQIPR